MDDYGSGYDTRLGGDSAGGAEVGASGGEYAFTQELRRILHAVR